MIQWTVWLDREEIQVCALSALSPDLGVPHAGIVSQVIKPRASGGSYPLGENPVYRFPSCCQETGQLDGGKLRLRSSYQVSGLDFLVSKWFCPPLVSEYISGRVSLRKSHLEIKFICRLSLFHLAPQKSLGGDSRGCRSSRWLWCLVCKQENLSWELQNPWKFTSGQARVPSSVGVAQREEAPCLKGLRQRVIG